MDVVECIFNFFFIFKIRKILEKRGRFPKGFVHKFLISSKNLRNTCWLHFEIIYVLVVV
jgi:hypothetical protein